MKLKSATAMLAVLAMASCQEKSNTQDTAKTKFIDSANMDFTINPGDNFFLYAGGNWLNKTNIPASESRWGSFDLLRENNINNLHNLLEELSKESAAKGTPEQKVGDFYKSGMDTANIEKAGVTPLDGVYADINNIKDANGVLSEIVDLRKKGMSQLFAFYIAPDDKDVTKQICQLSQGGLGLPDRDYYFKTEERYVKIREAYQQYIQNILVQSGMSEADAKKGATDIFNLELKLAQSSLSRVEMRDPDKMYNKYSFSGFSAVTPGMDWNSIFSQLGVKGEDSLIVTTPTFFTETGKLLTGTPVDVWKTYLRFHVTNDMAPYLSSNFGDLRFDFYGKTISGLEEQKPRWKRVLGQVDGDVGELLGRMYVDKHFKPEAKERMLTMISNLEDAYHERIQNLDWMSDDTKKRALHKLSTFVKKVGYPDKWRDYSKLEIVPDNYVHNIMAAAAFEYDYMLNKLGRPVDKTEWGMTPPTVNAYYNPAFNEIVFPAGILAFPFFDMSADDAVNYGGIGAVIGHEITHGFDDQGRKYDADGNLKDWWTADDTKKFEDKAQVVIDQFNGYTVLDTVHVNGELTLGENLADLGGLAISYQAFKKTAQGQDTTKIDGFTPDQRFFLSWAQVWRTKARPEETAKRIITDPHSPAEWRCNGPLSNMPEFYQAFGVKEGDKMYRPVDQRAKVW